MSTNSKRYNQEYYQKHKKRIIKQQLSKNKRLLEKRRIFIREYKAERCCSKCKEKEPCCLQFHHKDPKTKLFAISDADGLKSGMTRLLTEIAKCDILCANCHAKLHAGII